MVDRPRFSDPYLDAWAEKKWREGKRQEVEDLLSSMARAVAWTKPGSALPTQPIQGTDDIPYTPSLPPPGAEYYRPTGTGTLVPVAKVTGAGVFPVTEASAASINAGVAFGYRYGLAALPSISVFSGDNSIEMARCRKIGRVVITCDGAGAWANQSLVAAMVGYYGVCRVKSIKSNTNVAAGVGGLVFESPAATPALPSIEILPELVANVRRDDVVGCPVTHATLVDNQAIVVDGAGFGAGTVVEIEFEYWYET